MSRKENRFDCIRRIAATGAAAVLGAALAYVPAWAGVQSSVSTRADPPEVRIEMEGQPYSAADPEYYYRADNCGIRVFFSDHGQDLGRVREGETGIYRVTIDGSLEKNYVPGGAAETEAVIEYTPEEVAALGDGVHTIAVTAVDAAGGWAETVAEESRGCIFRGRTGQFVLDTTPPVFKLSVSAPGAARPDLCSQGNRYYFNSPFTAAVTVTDDNLDPADVSVLRGYTGGFRYDSSTAEVDEFTDLVSPELLDGNAVYTDFQQADGVYRYAVLGCDKAGNAVISLNGANLDGCTEDADLSCHIVIDTVRPEAAYAVSSGAADYFRYRTDGGVSLSIPFRTESSADIRAIVDEENEHTPVRASLRIEARPSELSSRCATDGFVYAPMLTLTQSGSQRFRLAGLTLTDLAGNVTRVDSDNWIFLDDAGGITDILPPATEVSAAMPSGAFTEDGKPLYREDVTLEIHVTDPFPETSGSGIGEVTADVFVDGARREEETYVLHEDVRNEYYADYLDPVPAFDRTWTLTVPAAGHNTNDILVTVRAADNAGNAATDASFAFGIDTAPPEVVVSYDNNDVRNGVYFREGRTARIEVTERNFDPALVRLENSEGASLSGWTRTKGAMQNGDDDLWTAFAAFSEEGEYSFSVDCYDAAGWPSPKAQYIGAAPQAFVIDRTPPAVTLTWEGGEAKNGCYYSKERTARIRVEEEHFGGECALQMEAAHGGKAPEVRFEEVEQFSGGETGMSEASGGEAESHFSSDGGETGAAFYGEAEACLDFTEEGTYRFSGTVTDLAGNVSEPFGEGTFVIDRTPPVLAIKGVSDLSANREAPDLTLFVTDEYLDEAGTTGVMVGTESGEVPFAAGGRDLAEVKPDLEGLATSGEEISAEVKPEQEGYAAAGGEISAEGEPVPEAWSATGGETLAEVDASHAERAEGTAGSVCLVPAEPLPDDHYRLTLTGTDLAGNRAERSVSFTVDREGPVFIFREEEALTKGYARQPFRPSFKIMDLDETTVLSVTVNGRETPYSRSGDILTLEEAVERDGIYRILVEGIDAAGNPSAMEPAEFRLDTRPPVILAEGLRRLENGEFEEFYTEPFQLILRHDRKEDRFVRLAVNGSEVPLDRCLTEDGRLSLDVDRYGRYYVEVTAADEAGNETRADYAFELTRFPMRFPGELRRRPMVWIAVVGIGVCVVLAVLRKL